MNVLMLLAQGAMNMADSLATANPVLTPVSAPEMNMLDMAVKGGWIMIVLGVLSVVCFYILFERNYMIRKAGKEDPMFMERIKDYIHSGEIKAAIQYCRTMNTPSARMIEKGISRLGRPINDVQVAIENVGNIEVAKLEKGLTVMATISGGAPMLGFLGTVTGMVRAFYEMANAGSGNIDITLLSGGIYEAMITTVGGLIVGIIAMFAYNYLVMLVDRVVNKMEARTMEFMDLAKARFSLRSYSDREVEPEKLTKILEAGRIAPTAKNNQPQRIYVLQGESITKAVKASRCTFGAPVVLVICYDKNDAAVLPMNSVNFGFVDASIVITQMMLQATELGLGSCWIGLFDEKIIRETLELPDDYVPVALLPLGYAADVATPSERHHDRKPLEQTVKYL